MGALTGTLKGGPNSGDQLGVDLIRTLKGRRDASDGLTLAHAWDPKI